MANEIHLYTLGADPFQLQVGGITFFVHQGPPPSDVTPIAPVKATTISTPARLGGSYQSYVIAPTQSRDVRELLDSAETEYIDLGVAVGDVGSPEGETDEGSSQHARRLLVGSQMAALYEGLSSRGEHHHVAVHVIHDPRGQLRA